MMELPKMSAQEVLRRADVPDKARGETLPPDAKFCPACGKPLGTQGGAGAADGGNGRAGQ